MKSGRDLELLVKKIEDVLAKDSIQSITSPCYIQDKISKEDREFDVVLVAKNGHHSTTIAFECKDYARPVDVGVIEAFHSKLSSCEVNIGIVVSSNGFTEQAQNKAAFYKIRCFTIEEVANLPHLLDTAVINFFRTEFKIIDVNSYIDDIENLEDLDSKIILAPDGTIVNDALLIRNIENYLNQNHINAPLTGEDRLKIKCMTPGFSIESKKLAKKFPVNRLEVTISLYTVHDVFPFKKMTYKKSTGEQIADMAVATIDTPKIKGDVTVVWDETGGQILINRMTLEQK